MEITDINVVESLRKHDMEIFRLIYERYFRKLCLFAESYLYDEEEARDLVQDLFFYIWSHAASLKITVSLKAYLFAAVRNRCLNVLRERKIKDEGNDKLFEAMLFSGAYDIAIDENTEFRLKEALNSLPAKCREIILLKILDEKKNKEIALLLDIAETTVKTQVQRAYRMLREKMIPVSLFIYWLCTKG